MSGPNRGLEIPTRTGGSLVGPDLAVSVLGSILTTDHLAGENPWIQIP